MWLAAVFVAALVRAGGAAPSGIRLSCSPDAHAANIADVGGARGPVKIENSPARVAMPRRSRGAHQGRDRNQVDKG